MYNDFLFLITARSGSKSIPNKNIKLLNGEPLLSYRIKQALKLTNKENVWISTDSPAYAEVAKANGAEVPFIRPNYLAADDANSIDVVLHALNHAKTINRDYYGIVLLEPTSPFVHFQDIINAIDLLKEENDAEAIIATKILDVNNIFIQNNSKYLDKLALNIDKVKSLSRQSFEEQITPSGGFYISKLDSIYKNKTFYTTKTLSYIINDISAIEIDNPIHWEWAEFLLKENIIQIDKIY